MKTSTLVLMCATVIATMSCNPTAALADVDFSINNQGFSIYLGDTVQFQEIPVFIEPNTVEWQRMPEWRRREIRIREERRFAEQREREAREHHDYSHRDVHTNHVRHDR